MCKCCDFHEKGGNAGENKTFQSHWIRRYTPVGCFCSSSTPRHPPSTFSLITRKSSNSIMNLLSRHPAQLELLSEPGFEYLPARVNKNGKLLNCSYHVNSFVNNKSCYVLSCRVDSNGTTKVFLFSRHYHAFLASDKNFFSPEWNGKLYSNAQDVCQNGTSKLCSFRVFRRKFYPWKKEEEKEMLWVKFPKVWSEMTAMEDVAH